VLDEVGLQLQLDVSFSKWNISIRDESKGPDLWGFVLF
jgi:hypothetical protein